MLRTPSCGARKDYGRYQEESVQILPTWVMGELLEAMAQARSEWVEEGSRDMIKRGWKKAENGLATTQVTGFGVGKWCVGI